jgi:hypothetical protein
MEVNLNETLIPNADGPDEPLKDYSLELQGISIHFRDLESRLIKYIDNSDAVFGCVAWLTNYKILDALSAKEKVSIVVQKEDFLKPDLKQGDNWRSVLKSKYDLLPGNVYRDSLPYPISEMSYGAWGGIDGIRCIGNNNKNKNPSFPRMHNKFLVFAKIITADADCPLDIRFEPYAVWSGSFNLSHCASMSFENAIFIKNKDIATAYFREFCQILAISEPLDWKSDWIQPEWRIGS